MDTDTPTAELGEALSALPDGYALESAISSTVSLLCDDQNAFAQDRLAAHLDALLAEQLRYVRQVSVSKETVVCRHLGGMEVRL